MSKNVAFSGKMKKTFYITTKKKCIFGYDKYSSGYKFFKILLNATTVWGKQD